MKKNCESKYYHAEIVFKKQKKKIIILRSKQNNKKIIRKSFLLVFSFVTDKEYGYLKCESSNKHSNKLKLVTKHFSIFLVKK